MRKIIRYKGYTGSVEFLEGECLYFGKILGIRALISYEGPTFRALVKDFREAVDDYLETCRETGTEPERANKVK